MEIIGVRFKKAGKIYYFDPDGAKAERGDNVIVETVRGIEFGNVEIGNKDIVDDEIVQPLKKVIRLATEDDILSNERNKEKEDKAIVICEEKVKEHGLDMKLIDVELTFDRNKIIFYFTSDGRVDFRELVKDLAAIFKMRIELRQIGVRDEAKIINSIGICGRCLCCATFLDEFQPVSIKMAKDQNLSLNPSKISGICGRLMCCLKYEQETYEELSKDLPNEGDVIATYDGCGHVLSVNILDRSVRASVKKKGEDERTIGIYPVEEIKLMGRRENLEKDDIDLNDAELKALLD